MNNSALISCYSDGIDILTLNLDNIGNLKLLPCKGDKISRTCISCVWISNNLFAISDKKNTIQLCVIEDDIKWIKTIRSVKFNEIVIRLFRLFDKIYCETISGTILDITSEVTK